MDPLLEIAELRRKLMERDELIDRMKDALIEAISACDRFDRHMEIKTMLLVMLGLCVG